MSPPDPQQQRVLIIGAGLIGLFLAHALHKNDIPIVIFERDATPTCRPQGWSMALHRALAHMQSCLPADVYERALLAQVDPEHDYCLAPGTERWPFLDASNNQVRAWIPFLGTQGRRRFRRWKLREALLEGVDVQFGKRLFGIKTHPDGVTAVFDDDTTASGWLLVGADGANSCTRGFVAPDNHVPRALPVRCLTVTPRVSSQTLESVLAVTKSQLWRCTHPDSGVSLFGAVLDRHADNTHTLQLNVSWLSPAPRDSERDSSPAAAPLASPERLREIRTRTENFASPLREILQGLDETETEAWELTIAESVLDETDEGWNNFDGRVTLAGDAAHAMTMFRGENLNHGVIDASNLATALTQILNGESGENGEMGRKEAIDAYEAEVRRRTTPAARLARSACLDAHARRPRWEQVRVGSALVERESKGSQL